VRSRAKPHPVVGAGAGGAQLLTFQNIEMRLLATVGMRLVLLASLAVAAAGCRPTYTCSHKSGSPTKSVCHAHWACTFSLCYPGQTCTMPFYLSSGVADLGAVGTCWHGVRVPSPPQPSRHSLGSWFLLCL